jgi:hypothetical protein
LAIAKITGQGLASIALLVVLLWACAIGQRVIVARANASTQEAVRDMRALQLKTRRQPSSAPVRPLRPCVHPKLG